MAGRALLFGSVASAYEQYRFDYPDALVDEVLAYGEQPLRTALEIGAGTGKATRAFAARGVTVTASDPDPEMLAELRRHVPDTVLTVQASLESLLPSPTYDLVFAAASLHWTEPSDRWRRVAGMLTAGGVFANFAGPPHLANAPLQDAVRAARSPFMSGDNVPSPDGTPADSPMQWPGTELMLSDLFDDVRQSTFEQSVTISAQDYVGYLSTVSAYLQLPGPAREGALKAILGVLPDSVDICLDVTLHLARLP